MSATKRRRQSISRRKWVGALRVKWDTRHEIVRLAAQKKRATAERLT